ncbi:MAG: hypothetical protein Q7S37_03885 [bacterium]|nr:hypothetical protein [bacterium]
MNKNDLMVNLPNMLKWKIGPGETPWDNLVLAVFGLMYASEAIFVIAIIYSGIMYITSGGLVGSETKPAKAAAAKKNLIWAITGFVIILLAIAITQWIPQALSGTLGD